MNKRIQSYNDLLVEKERLEILLAAQKETLRQDMLEIKEELAPVRSAISMAGKLVTRDSHNLLLNAGVDKLIDVVVRKFFLSRAGWITRLVVPFFLKNYSSHVIAENKNILLQKLFSWFGKKNANGQEKAYTTE